MVSIGSSNFLQLVGVSSCTTAPLSVSAGSSIYVGVSISGSGHVTSVTDNQGSLYTYLPWSESFDIPITASEIWYTDGIPGEGVFATPNLTITVTIQNVQNLCVSVTEIKGAANPSPSLLGVGGVATWGTGNMSVSAPVHTGEGFLLAVVTSTSPQYGTNVLTSTAPLYKINGTSNTPPSGAIISSGTFGYNGPFTDGNITLDVDDGNHCPNINSCVEWTIATVSILSCTLDCAGVCRGSSILDCAGKCYLPPDIPPHTLDCAGTCYDTRMKHPPHITECRKFGDKDDRESSRFSDKGLCWIMFVIILLLLLYIFIMSENRTKRRH